MKLLAVVLFIAACFFIRHTLNSIREGVSDGLSWLLPWDLDLFFTREYERDKQPLLFWAAILCDLAICIGLLYWSYQVFTST